MISSGPRRSYHEYSKLSRARVYRNDTMITSQIPAWSLPQSTRNHSSTKQTPTLDRWQFLVRYNSTNSTFRSFRGYSIQTCPRVHLTRNIISWSPSRQNLHSQVRYFWCVYRIQSSPTDILKLGVVFHSRNNEKLVTLPLVLPMRWTNSLLAFRNTTETAERLANKWTSTPSYVPSSRPLDQLAASFEDKPTLIPTPQHNAFLSLTLATRNP